MGWFTFYRIWAFKSQTVNLVGRDAILKQFLFKNKFYLPCRYHKEPIHHRSASGRSVTSKRNLWPLFGSRGHRPLPASEPMCLVPAEYAARSLVPYQFRYSLCQFLSAGTLFFFSFGRRRLRGGRKTGGLTLQLVPCELSGVTRNYL